MAVFKNSNPLDPLQSRINGIVFDSRQQTPVMRRWKSVQQHPSATFRRFDDEARLLDLRWDSMPGGDKDDWADFEDDDPLQWACDLFFDAPPEDLDDDPGQFAHRAVNIARLYTAAAYAALPPPRSIQVDSDIFTAQSDSGFSGIWAGRPATPAGDYYALVGVCGLNHEQETGLTSRRYRIAMSGPITYDGPLNLSPIFDTFSGLRRIPFLAFGVLIGEIGNAPFVGLRSGCLTPP